MKNAPIASPDWNALWPIVNAPVSMSPILALIPVFDVKVHESGTPPFEVEKLLVSDQSLDTAPFDALTRQ